MLEKARQKNAQEPLPHQRSYRSTKAVATDFEVVRPGSGCGLLNVGVVLIA